MKRLQSLSVIVILFVIIMLAAPSAFALSTSDFTGKAIATDFSSGMESIFTLLRYISYGVGIVYVAVVAYKMITGGQNGMEEGIQGIFKTVIFLFFILAAPYIAKEVIVWFSSGGTNNYSQFGNLG